MKDKVKGSKNGFKCQMDWLSLRLVQFSKSARGFMSQSRFGQFRLMPSFKNIYVFKFFLVRRFPRFERERGRNTSATTFSMTTRIITTFSISTPRITLKMRHSASSLVMLSVVRFYGHLECRYAEWRHAKCRGAEIWAAKIFAIFPKHI